MARWVPNSHGFLLGQLSGALHVPLRCGRASPRVLATIVKTPVPARLGGRTRLCVAVFGASLRRPRRGEGPPCGHLRLGARLRTRRAKLRFDIGGP